MVYVLLFLFWLGILAAIIFKSWLIAIITALVTLGMPAVFMAFFFRKTDEPESKAPQP